MMVSDISIVSQFGPFTGQCAASSIPDEAPVTITKMTCLIYTEIEHFDLLVLFFSLFHLGSLQLSHNRRDTKLPILKHFITVESFLRN